MARLQWLLVATGWLVVMASIVRARVRTAPHRRWLAALEALRQVVPTPESHPEAQSR